MFIVYIQNYLLKIENMFDWNFRVSYRNEYSKFLVFITCTTCGAHYFHDGSIDSCTKTAPKHMCSQWISSIVPYLRASFVHYDVYAEENKAPP